MPVLTKLIKVFGIIFVIIGMDGERQWNKRRCEQVAERRRVALRRVDSEDTTLRIG